MSGLQSVVPASSPSDGSPWPRWNRYALTAAARGDGEVVSTAPLVREPQARAVDAAGQAQRQVVLAERPHLRIDVAREQLVAGGVEDPHDVVEPREIDVERGVEQAGADQLDTNTAGADRPSCSRSRTVASACARTRDGVDVRREECLGELIDPAVRRLAICGQRVLCPLVQLRDGVQQLRALHGHPACLPIAERARGEPDPAPPATEREDDAHRQPLGRARSASCQMTAVITPGSASARAAANLASVVAP
jgi:hypothetical protein